MNEAASKRSLHPAARGRSVLGTLGGAVASLAAAAALVVAVRSVMALEFPRVRPLLGVSPIPRETLGLDWTSRAVWPEALQEAALGRVTGVVILLFVAALLVAAVNALVLLGEAGGARRREMAVRAAVGASPRVLISLLLGQLRALVGVGLATGGVVGGGAGWLLRWAWPGVTKSLMWGDAALTVAVALAVLGCATAVVYAWVGVSLGRPGVLSDLLRSGGRATDGRAENFRRRVLACVQMGLAGTVALGVLALMGAGSGPARLPEVSRDTTVVAVSGPARDGAWWRSTVARMEALPGVDSVVLASPGAVVGLGVRDGTTAQCGACVRGGLPLPLLGAIVDHHSVSAGFFEGRGQSLVAGRALKDGDGPGAPRVAVVNRTFARTSFEKGNPLGHLVRLGTDLDAWYEVVGVVEDDPTVVLGQDDRARAAVYLSAFQDVPAQGRLLIRGTEDGVSAVRGALEASGLQVGLPATLDQVVRQAAAPLLWLGRLALVLGALVFALALHGVHATTLQITRRRNHELAVRRALGAGASRLTAHVLAGSARTALAGAGVATFFGGLVVALIRKTAGGVPPVGATGYLAVASVLVCVALLASLQAVREAVLVPPAQSLE